MAALIEQEINTSKILDKTLIEEQRKHFLNWVNEFTEEERREFEKCRSRQAGQSTQQFLRESIEQALFRMCAANWLLLRHAGEKLLLSVSKGSRIIRSLDDF